jgi:hypothetical protein
MKTYEDPRNFTIVALEDEGLPLYCRKISGKCTFKTRTQGRDIHEEGYQSLEEEQEFLHDPIEGNENLTEEHFDVEEEAPHEDKCWCFLLHLMKSSKLPFLLHKKKRMW